MNLKIALLALAMMGTALASQSYHQPSHHGSHGTSHYTEFQSYINEPSYHSTHEGSYYTEPLTIKDNSYRPDLDSNKNNDYTFVTITGNDDHEIEKEVKGDIFLKVVPKESSHGYNKHHKDDHHESSYHQVDEKLDYLLNQYKGSSYNKPSYHKQEHTYKVEPSYHMTHKREPSYMVHKEEPSYYMVAKKQPTYLVHKKRSSYYPVHKQEPSYKQETPYKTYQPSHYDSYQQPTHYKESNHKQHSYKETYGKQVQYQDNMDGPDLYHNNYQQASELVSNAGIHRYSAKSKAPVIVKMTTMNNNKNVYNKQYNH